MVIEILVEHIQPLFLIRHDFEDQEKSTIQSHFGSSANRVTDSGENQKIFPTDVRITPAKQKCCFQP